MWTSLTVPGIPFDSRARLISRGVKSSSRTGIGSVMSPPYEPHPVGAMGSGFGYRRVMIELRAAAAGDGPSVLALWADAGLVQTVTDDVAAVENLIAHDAEALILAEDEGSLVGCVIAAWDGWRGEIYRLAVTPSRRRCGLGTRLLDEAVESLHRRGARRKACIVVADDIDARGFWDSTMFAAQSNRVRYVHPPD